MNSYCVDKFISMYFEHGRGDEQQTDTCIHVQI